MSASLLTDSGTLLGSVSPNTTVWHDGIQQNSIIPNNLSQLRSHVGSAQVGTSQVSATTHENIQIGVAQVSISEISSTKISFIEQSIAQISTSQISSSKLSPSEIAPLKIGISEIGKIQTAISQNSTPQVSINQDNSLHINFIKPSVDQIDTSKVPIKLDIIYPISTEVALPSSVSFPQFSSFDLKNHDLTPLLNTIYSTAQSIWHSNTTLNLTFNVTNLPTGQLAEATITGYDQHGRPNTATISIDDDANGVGWFLDTTPQDNSEFTGTDNYLQATPNSAASGKYDLLTAILHEMGHTLGFINGYSQFNQNIKGRQFYTDPTHSYTLSSDLSHLDNTLYPNDLLNTNLKPGIRKLPSAMDWAIINTINSGVSSGVSSVSINPAHLTAGALIGITNGDFTIPTTWNTEGVTNIINGTATLTEQSQKLSELTQAFIIPTGAKTLQFTIKDNHLIPGDTTKTANDAFEVALLDTNTFNPLAGTSIGLNHTDSLLNIQANGTIFHSDKVTITALTNNSSIVTIDLTQVTPTTQATLYFNLLGFGARTSTVTIDIEL